MDITCEVELSLEAEYENAELGDSRRTARLVKMVSSIAKRPDASMPEIFTTSAELEGCYRFCRNDKVSHKAMLDAHTVKTAQRARKCKIVIVAHDTTEFNFGKYPRKDLGRVGRGKSHGFYAHASVVLAGDREFLTLGTCALQIHRRNGKQAKNGGKQLHSERHADETNEGLRWFRGVVESEAVLAESENVIHVMDREADDYALFAKMVANNYRFVIRSSYDRLTNEKDEELSDEKKAKYKKISDALEGAPVMKGTREVLLSKRNKSGFPSQDNRHPARDRRPAELSVRAVRVAIQRPKSAPTTAPKTLELTLVQVIEQSPPEGEEPVMWNLWTSDECQNEEQAWEVVDAYRSRWVIEEYFKCLKTGCSFLKRQFEAEATLLRVLALFIPIAWWLLMLRTLNRIAPDRPATSMLSPVHIQCLGGALEKIDIELPAAPTINDLLMGIARLGGHIPRNGPPGWQVLLRGLEKLMLLAEGFQIAHRLMEAEADTG